MPVSSDIRAEKNKLREQMRSIRAGFSPQKKANFDRKIAENLLSLREYRESSRVFVYISKDMEVGTEDIVSASLNNGKLVAAPKCVPETRQTEFYRITSTSQLKKGYYGLLEPDPDICEKITDFSDGLCIVPGLAFDSDGYRLGFGMGYYDRFLNDFKGTTVGICYSDCVCQRLVRGYFDRSVKILVTERYIKGGNEK